MHAYVHKNSLLPALNCAHTTTANITCIEPQRVWKGETGNTHQLTNLAYLLVAQSGTHPDSG